MLKTFAVIIATLSVSGSAPAPDTSMFRGGPEHLGVYASATAPTLGTVVWKFKAGGKLISSPAVTPSAIYIGSADNVIYAVDRSDGTLKWKFTTGGPVNSSRVRVVQSVYGTAWPPVPPNQSIARDAISKGTACPPSNDTNSTLYP